jgi:hypothetical protein
VATKLYKLTFRARSLADVHDEVGRRGGLVVRIDQRADETTAYFEADDRAGAGRESGDEAREVSLDEVTKI